jgi:hypothetical protein
MTILMVDDDNASTETTDRTILILICLSKYQKVKPKLNFNKISFVV